MNKSTSSRQGRSLYLATAAVMAALYVVLTLPFAQIAFGPLQFRLAECMVVLPILMPAAIPGLTIGCFLANLLNPGNLGPIDIVFGSLATLFAAVLTYRIAKWAPFAKRMQNDIVALLPPIIVNALIVGTYLAFLLTEGAIRVTMIIVNIVSIGLSEMVIVYIIGLPILIVLRKAGLRSTKE